MITTTLVALILIVVTPEISFAAGLSDKSISEFLAGVTELDATADDNALVQEAKSISTKGEAQRASAYQQALRNIKAPSDVSTVRGEKEMKLYEAVADGVVYIGSYVGPDDFVIGSGSILSSDGLILTNYHVIEGADDVGVVFRRESFDDLKDSEIYISDVEKVDEIADLALIKIRYPPPQMKTLKLGTMKDVRVGLDVHAIGHPDDEYWTYTFGYISQVRLGYQWQYGNEMPSNSREADVVQTQTPINPGNSGGPLFNDNQEIIGINSFSNSDSEGLNFAVAASTIQEFLDRAGDRTFASSASAAPPVETHGGYTYFDRNNDGLTDIVTIDEDENGVIDSVWVDEDYDGETDYVLVDRDENGEVDARRDTEMIAGVPVYVWRFDDDEDGTPDVIGIDVDQDGTIDRYEQQ